MKPTYYAIKAKKGCWGNISRHIDSLIARIDGAKNKYEALEAFKKTSLDRSRCENEYEAIAPSSLSKSEREWVEHYVEEIIRMPGRPATGQGKTLYVPAPLVNQVEQIIKEFKSEGKN